MALRRARSGPPSQCPSHSTPLRHCLQEAACGLGMMDGAGACCWRPGMPISSHGSTCKGCCSCSFGGRHVCRYVEVRPKLGAVVHSRCGKGKPGAILVHYLVQRHEHLVLKLYVLPGLCGCGVCLHDSHMIHPIAIEGTRPKMPEMVHLN